MLANVTMYVRQRDRERQRDKKKWQCVKYVTNCGISCDLLLETPGLPTPLFLEAHQYLQAIQEYSIITDCFIWCFEPIILSTASIRTLQTHNHLPFPFHITNSQAKTVTTSPCSWGIYVSLVGTQMSEGVRRAGIKVHAFQPFQRCLEPSAE
jgi:hypothetical protein